MNNSFRNIAICVPLIGCVVMAVIAQRLYEEKKELSAELKSAQHQARLLDKAMERTSEEEFIGADENEDQLNNDRDARIEELEGLLSDLQARLDDAVADDAASDEEGAGDKSPMAAMYANFTEDMARSQAASQVAMLYKDFLDGLNVDDALREEIRAILVDFKGAEMFAGILMARGDLTREELVEMDYASQLRGAMREVLSREELAYYDDYEAGMQERSIRQAYGTQMEMLASEMTEENRTMALDLLVDEMLARQAIEAESPNSDGDPAMDFQNAIDMFDSVALQLSEVLPEDQYAAFERFVDQIVNSMQMMQQMVEPTEE
jgi:hypothetical protein